MNRQDEIADQYRKAYSDKTGLGEELNGWPNQSVWPDDRRCEIPLMLEPQPEGGFTVTSPLLPGLVTEGETISEALANVQDALAAVIEIYQDLRHRKI